MQSCYVWVFLIMLILVALGGLLVHTYATRGTVHRAYGGDSGVSRRSPHRR